MTTSEFAPSLPSRGDRVTSMMRADIDVRSFYRWAGARGMISRNAFDPGLRHALPSGRAASVTWRQSRSESSCRGIGGAHAGRSTATATPAQLSIRSAALTFACPLQSQILPASRIDSKPMPTSWQKGLRLGFEVLVRPVVRCARGSENSGREIDAFQAVAERQPKGRMKRDREEVYSDWLSDRLAQRGVCLEEARLVSFQRVRVVRKVRSHASEGPDAVMRGSITVTEPSKFADLVARGIGRHRAYGYGMILLRPALDPGRR